MSKNFSKFFPIVIFLSTFFCVEVAKSDANNSFNLNNKSISSSYLDSRKELEDYIIGKGDSLFIDFYPASELNGIFSVTEVGEVYLPRLQEVNVSGLTPSELEILLDEKYSEFLISPAIKVKIAKFKEIKVIITGDVRYPGSYTFPAYDSLSLSNFLSDIETSKDFDDKSRNSKEYVNDQISYTLGKNYFQNEETLNNQSKIGKSTENSKNISDVIRKAGGITSSSDLTRVKIVRNLPLGKGGGKKVAVVNLNNFLDEFDSKNDLRLFDNDQIFIPSLKNFNKEQISKSVVTGLSPRFVEVNIYGRINNPGTFKLPLESTLSDAIDITGPIKPLSGKVVLIRYNSDGSISKQKISYSSGAARGSKRNPYIKEGDLITVTSSFLSKTTDVIREVTAPIQGIYFTNELINNF